MSNSFDFEPSGDFANDRAFITHPGIYHLVVVEVTNGAGPQGSAIDGFFIKCEAVAGTVESESGKTINLTFFRPKVTEKDGGAFKQKLFSRFFLATNQIDPSKAGGAASVDLDKLAGQNFLCRLEHDKEKKYLQLAGLDVWHVDDPTAPPCPKKEAELKLIPGLLRHPAAWFEQHVYKKNSPSSGGAPAGSKGTATPSSSGSAAATAVTADDL